MVSGHACIRVQKMALALVEKRHKVYHVAGKMPSYVENYESFMLCTHLDQYIEGIKLLADKVDIFHAHNEPSWFVNMIKEHCNVPVILDVHDSYLARMTSEEEDYLKSQGKDVYRVLTEERNNFQLADGLVFPGEKFGNMIRSEFKLNQPYLILPSYLPRKLYKYDTYEWLGGIVYEGRVDLTEENEKDNNHGFRYANYERFAQKAHEQGIDFHIYANRKDEKFLNTYKDIAYVHEPKPFDKLLKSIGKHDWGLVGNLDYTPEWNVAFPNKLFDYIGACVPIVAMKADSVAKFITEHDIGIEVESMEELRDRWHEHTRCRKNLMRIRQELSMDAHIDKLEKLYETVISKDLEIDCFKIPESATQYSNYPYEITLQ